MDFSKIRFEAKEVVYVALAVIGYVGQLAHINSKFDEFRLRTELRLQGVEFRLNTIENKPLAILPKEPKFENE